MTELHADDLPYWKTGKSSPEVWLDKAEIEIERMGGEVRARGTAFMDGRGVIMLAFDAVGDSFNIKWPVLTPKRDTPTDRGAAMRQAATMVYHDVKARSVSARVMGVRHAFHSYLLLPGGQTAGEMTTPELMDSMPKLLMPYDHPTP